MQTTSIGKSVECEKLFKQTMFELRQCQPWTLVDSLVIEGNYCSLRSRHCLEIFDISTKLKQLLTVSCSGSTFKLQEFSWPLISRLIDQDILEIGVVQQLCAKIQVLCRRWQRIKKKSINILPSPTSASQHPEHCLTIPMTVQMSKKRSDNNAGQVKLDGLQDSSALIDGLCGLPWIGWNHEFLTTNMIFEPPNSSFACLHEECIYLPQHLFVFYPGKSLLIAQYHPFHLRNSHQPIAETILLKVDQKSSTAIKAWSLFGEVLESIPTWPLQLWYENQTSVEKNTKNFTKMRKFYKRVLGMD